VLAPKAGTHGPLDPGRIERTKTCSHLRPARSPTDPVDPTLIGSIPVSASGLTAAPSSSRRRTLPPPSRCECCPSAAH